MFETENSMWNFPSLTNHWRFWTILKIISKIGTYSYCTPLLICIGDCATVLVVWLPIILKYYCSHLWLRTPHAFIVASAWYEIQITVLNLICIIWCPFRTLLNRCLSTIIYSLFYQLRKADFISLFSITDIYEAKNTYKSLFLGHFSQFS